MPPKEVMENRYLYNLIQSNCIDSIVHQIHKTFFGFINNCFKGNIKKWEIRNHTNIYLANLQAYDAFENVPWETMCISSNTETTLLILSSTDPKQF